MKPEESQQIKDTLKARGADMICPVCRTEERKADLKLANHYVSTPLSQETTGPLNVYAPGSLMACAALICTNCGYMRWHNLQMLGLV